MCRNVGDGGSNVTAARKNDVMGDNSSRDPLDNLCVNTVRFPAVDAAQEVDSGHPNSVFWHKTH